MKIDFGLIRIAALRTLPIFHVWNTAGVLYLIFREGGFHWWYLLFLIPVALYVYFDMKVIWEQEKKHTFDNPQILEILKKLERIENRD